MQRTILPVLFSFVMLIILLSINKEPAVAGYILAIGLGVGIGSILNQLFFRKSKKEEDLPVESSDVISDESDAKSA